MDSGNRHNDMLVAKAYDKYLYLSELEEIVPKGVSPEDSVQLVKDHIDKWIRNNLLLYQAQENLDQQDKYIERQIDDYRTSLLIFKYEQKYISQKLDTTVTDKEIEDYYNEYSSNFILNNNLLRGIFVKIPRSAPDSWKARQWYKSDNPEHLKDLEKYCFNYATDFVYFDEEWNKFSDILPKLPAIYSSPDNFLRNRKYYETNDSTYYYFLKISEYKLEGSVTPLDMVREDIKSILLNKRKIQLIQELEANIYNDALNRENFVVYN
jgi:hypothetical protein